MKVVSTFSGCGGSSLGYKMAGCEVVAAVEFEAHAAECYRANHPDTVMFERDIAKITGAEILEAAGLSVGELDILDGSPPCQGFSTSGSRQLDDPRNNLFRQHLRLVDELEPRNVMIENVAGMIQGKMRSVAGEIVQSLKDRGYKVAAGLMLACHFGVGQRRPRVFFIASRVGQPSLPRPTTRIKTTREALRGVEPGWIPPFRSAHHRFWGLSLLPGETGQQCVQRLGIPVNPNSFHAKIKMHPDKPGFTLTKSADSVYHWTGRFLTAHEAKVLTGFPADYKLPAPAGSTKLHRHGLAFARIGNAVAPPMTREIALQVFGAL